MHHFVNTQPVALRWASVGRQRADQETVSQPLLSRTSPSGRVKSSFHHVGWKSSHRNTHIQKNGLGSVLCVRMNLARRLSLWNICKRRELAWMSGFWTVSCGDLSLCTHGGVNAGHSLVAESGDEGPEEETRLRL